MNRMRIGCREVISDDSVPNRSLELDVRNSTSMECTRHDANKAFGVDFSHNSSGVGVCERIVQEFRR